MLIRPDRLHSYCAAWNDAFARATYRTMSRGLTRLVRSSQEANGSRQFISEMVAVGVGVAGSRLVNIATLVLMARWLSPSQFGQFSVATSLMATIGQFPASVDYGFVALYQDSDRQRPTLRYAYRNIKLLIAVGIAIGGFTIAPFLSVHLLHDSRHVDLMRLAVLGAATYMLFLNAPAHFQANGKYPAMSKALLAYSVLTLAGIAVVTVWVASPRPADYLIAWTLTSSCSALWSLLVSGRPIRLAVWGGREMRQLLYFTSWATAGTVASAILLRLDLFLVSSRLGAKDAAYYSAAVRYASIFEIALAALMSFTLPKGSAIRTRAQLRIYLRGIAQICCAFLVLVVALTLAAPKILPVILGPNYESISTVAQLLILVRLPLIILIPLATLFFAPGRLHWVAIVNAAEIIVQLFAGYMMTGAYGLYGTAWSALITNCAGLAVTVLGLSKCLGEQWWKASRLDKGMVRL